MKRGNARVKMSRESSAKRKRRERNNMRDEGFKILQFYVHPDDRDRVTRLVNKLRTARTGDETEE